MINQPIQFEFEINMLSSPFRKIHPAWNRISLMAARLSAFLAKGCSSGAGALAFLSEATIVQYNKLLGYRWIFCKEKQADLFSLPMFLVLEFLASSLVR